MGGIDGRGQVFEGQTDTTLCLVFIAIHRQQEKAGKAGRRIADTLCMCVIEHETEYVGHVEHEIPAE